MNEIRSFIEWLSYHPTADEIARALVLDHLASLGACCARIGLLNPDDSLTFAGEYGFDDGRQGGTFSSAGSHSQAARNTSSTPTVARQVRACAAPTSTRRQPRYPQSAGRHSGQGRGDWRAHGRATGAGTIPDQA